MRNVQIMYDQRRDDDTDECELHGNKEKGERETASFSWIIDHIAIAGDAKDDLVKNRNEPAV